MSAGASKTMIHNGLSSEAAALAKAVIDSWGEVTYQNALLNKSEASLLLRATKNGASLLLGVVGSMNFGFDGTGPRYTAEILAHTKSFGELEAIQRKLFAPAASSVLTLPAASK